jgi:hypothetical protein
LGKAAKKRGKSEERQNIQIGLSNFDAFLLNNVFVNFWGQSDLIIA